MATRNTQLQDEENKRNMEIVDALPTAAIELIIEMSSVQDAEMWFMQPEIEALSALEKWYREVVCK